MKGVFQGKPIQPEGDLWDHTLLVLKLLRPNPSFALAFAALLHDVGKPPTKAIHNGRFSFHHHEQVGRRFAERPLPQAQALTTPSASELPGSSSSTSILARPSGSARPS